MTKITSVTQARNKTDIDKAVKSQGGYVQTGGKHPKYVNPNTGGKVPFPSHPGDLAPGTFKSIIKMLVGIGFTIYCIVIIRILEVIP